MKEYLLPLLSRKKFSQKDVKQYSGVTRGVLNYWIKCCVLDTAKGPKWRRFSAHDIFRMSVLNALRSLGVPVSLLPNPAKDKSLTIERFLDFLDGKPLRVTYRRGHVYFVVTLSGIFEDLKKRGLFDAL